MSRNTLKFDEWKAETKVELEKQSKREFAQNMLAKLKVHQAIGGDPKKAQMVLDIAGPGQVEMVLAYFKFELEGCDLRLPAGTPGIDILNRIANELLTIGHGIELASNYVDSMNHAELPEPLAVTEVPVRIKRAMLGTAKLMQFYSERIMGKIASHMRKCKERGIAVA